MRQVVIGAGEVGTALAEVLGCDVVDIDGHQGTADVLHIAFPWSAGFDAAVTGYRDRYGAGLVVIHSTVPVGTSDRLDAVHSPVTGRHPNLAPSLRRFAKWFGGRRSAEAAGLFTRAGVRVRCVEDARATEAMKLWQTLQFGWLVALEKEAHRYAFEQGIDFATMYAAGNETYNDGYALMGEPWRLPVVAHMPGPIGGHCIIPNARILQDDVSLAAMLVCLDDGWRAA